MRNLLFVLLCFSSINAFSKFTGPFPDSPDLPIIIQQAFNKLTGVETASVVAISNKCKAVNLNNKTALADFDVLSGFPYASEINPSFWKWYYDCIESYATNSLLSSEVGFKSALGTAGAQHFADTSIDNIKQTLWQSVPNQVRTDTIKSILNTLIRDDLLAEFGVKSQDIIIEIETVLNHPSRSQFKVGQALMVILQMVFKQESFILE